MNDKFLEQVKGNLDEYIKQYRKMLRQEFRDLHWDTHSISDAEHAKWFMLMARQNPNWVRALPYVEGGMNELRRFERTIGIGRYATDEVQ